MPELPEHSPLGASSAERWMECPGSVALIRAIGPEDLTDEPDYRREGVLAHALAAHCLTNKVEYCWEVMGEGDFAELDAETASAVQDYLDFCRSLGGRCLIEHKMHRPEFHAQAFGTGDYIAYGVAADWLHVVDYKHGVGIAVSAVENPQGKYYVYLHVGEDRDTYPDACPVKFTIVQPRGFHPDGPIRTWETTAGAVRAWANDVLKPAMIAAETEHWLSLGSWCRFCPAKLVCPAMDGLARKSLAVGSKYDAAAMQVVPDVTLGKWFAELECLKMIVKARGDEVRRRLLQGDAVPGAKLVYAKVDRIFKDDAPVEQTFGADAWDKPKLLGPARVEKLSGGKAFVADWAFKPLGALAVAPDSDSRAAVTATPTDEKFKAALAALDKAE